MKRGGRVTGWNTDHWPLVSAYQACNKRRMMTTRIILALAFVGLLAACAEKPSITNSDATALSDYDVVSLCYSAKTTTREELATLALQACPGGTGRVAVWDHDTLLNSCPISKKNRVTYQCLP